MNDHSNTTVGLLPGIAAARLLMLASQAVWDEATLDSFLAKPKEVVPKTKMAFPGLKKEADRQDVIAYMKEAGQ